VCVRVRALQVGDLLGSGTISGQVGQDAPTPEVRERASEPSLSDTPLRVYKAYLTGRDPTAAADAGGGGHREAGYEPGCATACCAA
jgi:2-keto-4-pentenoate hydratase/2-oxohepta-3-ene-1,7-dioic acid hydratase in catechol pathway